jgi:predicted DNA-binding transcriptional regulator YafY
MKIDRLLAIVMLLLHNKKISAHQLANYFEVSVRTIQRDIDAIGSAGIPVFANKGKNGGYSILENYKIDKNFLTAEEVNSLVSVLKGFTKAYEDMKIKNIIEKVSGLMSDSNIDINRNKLIVDMSYWGNNEVVKSKINLISKAVDEFSILSFDYTDSNLKSTQRKVEPVSLVLKMNSWYLYAYCMYRDDFRLFKLSRIRNLKIINGKFSQREMPDKFPWEGCWNTENEKQRFVFKFNSKAISKLTDYFDVDNIKVGDDGSAVVTVHYLEDEWVYGMILSFGSDIEVLEPQHVREIIKVRAEEILKKYNK